MPFRPAASALMLPPVAPRARAPSTRLVVAEGEVGDRSGCGCWPPNKLSRFAAMLPAAGGVARVLEEEEEEEGVVGVAVSCDRGVAGVAVAAGGVVAVEEVPGGFAPALVEVGEPKSAARFAAKLVPDDPSGEARLPDEAEEGDVREEAPPFDCDSDTRRA